MGADAERALVLHGTFSSFPDMAQRTFPWFPGRWLVRNQLDNLRKIARCRGPVSYDRSST